ncbi:MAG TPA: hypothetical protein VF668_03435 [Pyrinomonadaceae bacterium]|jgi:hypothetical protein
MKKQISRALLGLVAVLTLAGAASAQTSGGIKVHVPFDFVAGGKQLPAGEYDVRRVKADSESAIVIRGVAKGATAVILTNAGGDRPAAAALDFRQRGGRYFLAAVSMPGAASVREAQRSKAGRELIGQAEAGAGDAKRVTVLGDAR